MEICKTRHALGIVLALLVAGMTSAAWAQADADAMDLTPPSAQAGAAEDAALARAQFWMDEWEGERGLLEAAGREIESVLARQPESAEAHFNYARYLFKSAMITSSNYESGGLLAAERALDRVLELDPGNLDAILLRSAVYRQQGRMPLARAALEQAEAKGDTSDYLHELWADVLMEEGSPEAALARCARIDGARLAADQCAIWPLFRLKRNDEADHRYRAVIRHRPESAWALGNHAMFLLCRMDDPAQAAEQAGRALALMDYGTARRTHAAALYQQWTKLANAGKTLEAEQAWARAASVAPGDPVSYIVGACHVGAAKPMLKALRNSGRAAVLAPAMAVVLASEVAPDWLPGVFGLEVRGSGRGSGAEAGVVFLNSDEDYRNPVSVTVRFTPEAAAGWRELHGNEPDVALAGKTILVHGFARRNRIIFTSGGMPSGKFYYQTHILVTEPDQVVVYDPDAPTPAPPPPPQPQKPLLQT